MILQHGEVRMAPPKKDAAPKAPKTGKLAMIMEAGKKILKGDSWRVELDPDAMERSLPHVPTGSMIIDYLIGGVPNANGVQPCPGFPRKRITQLWGAEGCGKCLPADTYVNTPEGLLTIGEIFEREGNPAVCVTRTAEATINLINRYGEVEPTTHITHNGRKPTYRIRTFSGANIRSTGNHPHLVMDPSGFWTWKMTRNLQPGDVMISPRTAPFGTNTVSADDAYSVGVIVADAYCSTNRVSVTNDDPDIKDHITGRMPNLFGGKIALEYDDNNGQGSIDYHFNSEEHCGLFYTRFGLEAVNSPKKTLGAPIRSFDETSLREFLRGYFDCECSVDLERGVVEVTSASHELLLQVKLLLTRFGIVGLLREKTVKAYSDNDYWRLTLSGSEARSFIQKIGSRSSRRIAEYTSLLTEKTQCSTNHDTVPHCGGLLQALHGQEMREKDSSRISADYRGQNPKAQLTKDRLTQILADAGDNSLVSQRLREILRSDYYYDAIEDIEACEAEPTFDFAMSRTASFIANGFVTHNTTMALTAAAATIKAGGVVFYVDWENAIVPDYAATLGVPVTDAEKFMLVQPSTLEEGVKLIKIAALGGVDLLIIDSVGAAVPANIADRDVSETGEQARVGLSAKVWSEFLPDLRAVILRSNTAVLGISQIRAKIGGMGHGPQSEPQGGFAWKFFSDARIEIRRVQQEKIKLVNGLTNKTEERIVGSIVKAKMVKCKLSDSQGREENFYLRQGSGIDDIRSTIEIAIAYNTIRKSGGWFYYDEEKWQGMEQVRRYFAEKNDAFLDLVRKVKPHLTKKTDDGPESDVDDNPEEVDAFTEMMAEMEA